MSVEIKLDDRHAKRQLKELASEAKKAGQIKLDPDQADSSGSREKKRSSSSSKKKAELRRNMARGGDTSDQATSGMDEFESGGFYETLKDKAEVLKKAKDQTIKTAKWLKSKITGKKSGSAGGADGDEEGSGDGEKKIRQLIAEQSNVRTLNIQNAMIRNVRSAGGVMSAPGGGGGGEDGGQSSGGKTGFIASAVGKAMPFVGALAVAAGAVMKIVSEVGQRYVQALMSQADTFGSTGRYRASPGPAGLFRDAEVAQGEVAFAKSADAETFKRKKSLLDENALRFASRRGMSPAELGESLGTISRGQQEATGINYLRSYAEKSGYQAMRQGEAITKLAEATRQLREQGYGNLNVRQFAPIAAAFTHADAVLPERGLAIAQNLDRRIRSGEQGGMIGQLMLAKKMQEGKDFFTAKMEWQRDGLTADVMPSLLKAFGGDKQMLAYVMEREGISPMREAAAALETDAVTINDRTDQMAVANNPGLAFSNRSLRAFGTGPGAAAGAAAIKIAETGQKKLIDMLGNHAGKIETLANSIHDVEMKIFDKMSEGVSMLEEMINNPAKSLSAIGEYFSSLIKDSMPGWIKF
jgi:hypothetical protein